MNPSALCSLAPPVGVSSPTVALSLTGFLAVALLSGCASAPASHSVSAPPPAAPNPTREVTTTTTTESSPQVVAVPAVVNGQAVTITRSEPSTVTTVTTQAPPAPQSESVPLQPSSRHVLIPGYWAWKNERYEWVTQHWELPPTPRSVWTAPRWVREANAYRFFEGYWN